jgi:hypothetical protein
MLSAFLRIAEIRSPAQLEILWLNPPVRMPDRQFPPRNILVGQTAFLIIRGLTISVSTLTPTAAAVLKLTNDRKPEARPRPRGSAIVYGYVSPDLALLRAGAFGGTDSTKQGQFAKRLPPPLLFAQDA